MATSRRLPSTLALATKTSTTPYICASCRSQAPISSIPSQPSQIRHNSNLPFTERLRRRIWGTDNPPGLKDPYGGPSFLERRLAERRGEQVSRQESQPTQLEEPSSEVPAPMRREAISPKRQAVETRAPVVKEPKPYEEATTWRGLKWIGETGSYRHMPRTEADDYEPYVRKQALSTPELTITGGLRRRVDQGDCLRARYGKRSMRLYSTPCSQKTTHTQTHSQ